MPQFPQYQNAVLVEFANIVSHTATASSAATAASGDVHVYNSAATGWPLTLPPVATGGPVKVVNIHATGTVVVSPTEVTTSVTVNGGASYTVPAGATGAAATAATFFSDGSANWYSG
jgi:hypothetical protein